MLSVLIIGRISALLCGLSPKLRETRREAESKYACSSLRTMSFYGRFSFECFRAHLESDTERGKIWTEECKQPFQVLALNISILLSLHYGKVGRKRLKCFSSFRILTKELGGEKREIQPPKPFRRIRKGNDL